MQYMVPVDTTFTHLVCRTSASGATTFKVRVNAVDTTFTCSTTTTAAVTANGSLTVSAGDLVSIHVQSTSSTSRTVWWALS